MTDKEIIQALRCMATRDERRDCEIAKRSQLGCAECISSYIRDAADAIERLTAENAVLPNGEASAIESLRKEIEWKDMVIALAKRKQAEAEAERDALIEQIKERHDCMDCKHNDYCEFDDANVIDCMNCVKGNCPCAQCCDSSRWEWRGLPETPEEGDKHE